MRQPLEDGVVSIGRARGTVVFPARFMLVGAMNPCPCGYAGDTTRACTCQSGAVDRYQKRLSGPLLDRIDLHVEVPRIEYEKLAADSIAESSGTVRARVEAARARQWDRFAGSRVACPNCRALVLAAAAAPLPIEPPTAPPSIAPAAARPSPTTATPVEQAPLALSAKNRFRRRHRDR